MPSAFLNVIEIVLYFCVIGFFIGFIVVLLSLAPFLLLTLGFTFLVFCVAWPILLPVLITIKRTQMVSKVVDYAIERKPVRKCVLFFYDKACTL